MTEHEQACYKIAIEEGLAASVNDFNQVEKLASLLISAYQLAETLSHANKEFLEFTTNHKGADITLAAGGDAHELMKGIVDIARNGL